MAGFLKKSQRTRWDNAASIVEGGGAGWRRVPGIYREPRGAGGGGINIIVARAQENVDHTMAVFDATVAAVFLGTGPAVDTVITVDNFDSGKIDEAAVGDILGAYRAVGLTGEEVFILLKGMNCMCFEKTDGNWQIFQAGGAFNDTAVGDTVSPFSPGLGV